MTQFARKILVKSLKYYRIRFATAISISIIIILLLFGFSLESFIVALKGIREFKSIINNISNLEEKLEFENANFSLRLEREDGGFFVSSKLQKNNSNEFSFTGNKPYKMNNFSAEINKTLKEKPEPDQWIEQLKIKSNFATILQDGFEISQNINGIYKSKINPQFNNTHIFADEMQIFHNLDVKGKNIRIRGTNETFYANDFTFSKSGNMANFFNKVQIENLDYKIESEILDVLILNGKPESMMFRKNVVFRQKNAEKTVIYGDNAFYSNSKSEIKIYGNVRASSQKNSFSANGDAFYYDINTKRGRLEGKKLKDENGGETLNQNKGKIEIELYV